jgi:O-antigen/teichoic acid export membrane protein
MRELMPEGIDKFCYPSSNVCLRSDILIPAKSDVDTESRVHHTSAGIYRTTVWALCDQAIVSGGNFLTNLVLIRSLSPPSYGVYALLLNLLLFLNNLHAAMIAYPTCIIGARSDPQALRGVATGGLLATLSAAVVNGALIIGACISVHNPRLVPVVLLAALAWQLQETLRTVFVSQLEYRRAIAGDAISYIGQAGILASLCVYRLPGLSTIFCVIFFTSVGAGIFQASQIRPHGVEWDALRSYARELVRLGKWGVLAKIMAFFSLQAFPWVLAYTRGLASVASFQALFQLVALANPLLLSFNGLIISSIAREANSTDSPDGMTRASKQIRLAAVIFALYFTGLALGGRIAMNFLYGRGSPYLANTSLVRYFALAYAFEAVSMFAGAILGGFGETRATFVSQLAAMAVAILFVIPWIIHSGLSAAVIGLVAVNGTRAAAGWFLVRYTAVKRASAPIEVPV